ncbi:MAG: hypothetical protein K8I60_22580 [Anaerolineae bacterium]|nr:hypothetical protein [Anaerolineae bacterium]
MKNILYLCFIMGLMLVGSISMAQSEDDSCQPSVVVNAFAEAITADQVSAWEDAYLAGNCPEAIKTGVQSLVRTYEAMQVAAPTTETVTTPPDELPEVTVGGEHPVVEFSNVLGLGGRMNVDRSGYRDDQRCIYIGGVVIEIMPRLFVSAPLVNVRRITQTDETYRVLYTDGQVMSGHSVFTLFDTDGKTYDMAGVSNYTLISVPETQPPDATPEGRQLWQVTLPDDGLEFTGENPNFYYRWAGCNVTVIGGSPTGTSSSFNLTFNDQQLRVNISDFAAVSMLDDAITVTAPNGQQTTGTLSVGSDRTTDTRWFLRLEIGGGRTLWVDSGAHFTLSKVGN